jgi:predicted RNA-binding protein with PUA-like domain
MLFNLVLRWPASLSLAMRFWMVKQEPSAYSWNQFVQDGRTAWTGVRNYQARIHLRAMRTGDRVLFYHSVVGKEVVGLAEVAREAYPDPTAEDGEWVCVDLVPVEPLGRPVPLAEIKAAPALADLPLLKQSRLSVMPLTSDHFSKLLTLGQSSSKKPISRKKK